MNPAKTSIFARKLFAGKAVILRSDDDDEDDDYDDDDEYDEENDDDDVERSDEVVPSGKMRAEPERSGRSKVRHYSTPG